MAVNFYSSWRYLTHNCPIDLSGDEAQYWVWSRHLDLSYYSKGPMVAYIIRASCAILGDTMPAVRLPALLFAIGTSICTYWLTRKLFGSDRLALGAVLIGGIVPMYAAGGMLMTIDPPFFFFWALATCLAATAIFDNKNWAWPLAGVAAGLGILTKYGMLGWPPIVLLFLLFDRQSRSKLKTPGPWLMTGMALLSLIPVLIWNIKHDWVTFHHVATQTAGGGGDFFSFVAAQFFVINPLLAGLILAATVDTFRGRAKTVPDPIIFSDDSKTAYLSDKTREKTGSGTVFISEEGSVGAGNAAKSAEYLQIKKGSGTVLILARRRQRGSVFLLTIGGTFFLVCLLDSVFAKVQVNWPAPAYFTLFILAAYFVSVRWRSARGWFVAAVIFGLAVQPVLHDLTMLYPLARWLDQHHPRKPREGTPQSWVRALDAEYKLRGIARPLASSIDAELAKMPAGSFVLCEAYEDASELEFYLRGHPTTYFAGSYWTAPFPIRRRWTQFDIWPDRALDQPSLIGRDAIYVGFAGYAPLKDSFASMERLPDVVVEVKGMVVQRCSIWKCSGFKGMRRPNGPSPR
jgi:4-amino-4-deoxy-L-arabinose transferase-like glycosyltransferase